MAQHTGVDQELLWDLQAEAEVATVQTAIKAITWGVDHQATVGLAQLALPTAFPWVHQATPEGQDRWGLPLAVYLPEPAPPPAFPWVHHPTQASAVQWEAVLPAP